MISGIPPGPLLTAFLSHERTAARWECHFLWAESLNTVKAILGDGNSPESCHRKGDGGSNPFTPREF